MNPRGQCGHARTRHTDSASRRVTANSPSTTLSGETVGVISRDGLTIGIARGQMSACPRDADTPLSTSVRVQPPTTTTPAATPPADEIPDPFADPGIDDDELGDDL